MTPDKERLDAVLEAAEWLLRHEAEPLTEAEKAEFLAWLTASPLHVQEYLGVARAAHHLPVAFRKHSMGADAIDAPLDADLEALRAAVRSVPPDKMPAEHEQEIVRRLMQGIGLTERNGKFKGAE